MTPDKIAKLIQQCRAHGVSRIRVGDVEVVFDGEHTGARRRGPDRPKAEDAVDLALRLRGRPDESE